MLLFSTSATASLKQSILSDALSQTFKDDISMARDLDII